MVWLLSILLSEMDALIKCNVGIHKMNLLFRRLCLLAFKLSKIKSLHYITSVKHENGLLKSLQKSKPTCQFPRPVGRHRRLRDEKEIRFGI